ncbi:mannose-1-phosphate guanylyltransferase [Cnuella takakiae]|uniref:Mannose-1-phosphate guanylyltransferase n=1 Tax=Cnuella takakiae TaxID=1302690 RepID=A0A1M5E372_9BACT|nr:sugar phosphate nucleotidyltransferase [Cnuella takakiae]OLY93796.1 hypothetical protein BUE76_19330 [Cnuella takakiae]SHF73521.1 mannose-1-phosphate guanylyltransferase [Cnuella takakiae]
MSLQINKTFVAIITHRFEASLSGPEETFLPRAFTDFLGTGKTLLQQTFERFVPHVPSEHIIIVTAAVYRALAMEQLPLIHPGQVMGVPVSKSPAAILAHLAFKLPQQDSGVSLIVAPADHLVLQNHAFLHVCSHAIGVVNSRGGVVVLGVQPTHVNQYYRYIKRSAKCVDEGVFRVEQFLEHTTVQYPSFHPEDRYLWHTGIYIWKVTDLLGAIRRLLPTLFRCFKNAALSFNSASEEAALQLAYASSPAANFDTEAFCKSEKIYVIPGSFGWSDIGTWYEPQSPPSETT